MIVAESFLNITVYQGLDLQKGKKYVMSPAVLRQLLKIYPGGLAQTDEFDHLYNKLDLSRFKFGERVFLFRSGGIGDVMFMLPLARYLKEEYGAYIKVATSPMYCDVLGNNPYLNKIIRMPFESIEFENTDWSLMFEGLIEDVGKKSQILNSVDLFMEEAGVNFREVSSDKKIPYLFLTSKEKIKAENEVVRLSKKKPSLCVGVQIEASSPIRTFPVEKMIAVIKKLIDENFVVFVFGGKRQEYIGNYLNDLFFSEPNLVNLIPRGYSLRDSIAIASCMDLFIAPDSAFIHIAGGLGVPVIGLYGCFPSKLRMKYYHNAIGIDCDVACAPSFVHGHSPCPKGFPSPCFSVIAVDNVMDAVFHLLGKKKVSLIYPTFNEYASGEAVVSSFSHERIIGRGEVNSETESSS